MNIYNKCCYHPNPLPFQLTKYYLVWFRKLNRLIFSLFIIDIVKAN